MIWYDFFGNSAFYTHVCTVAILKILGLFASPVEIISRFREPNEDILRLLDNSDSISFIYLFIMLVLFYFISRDFLKKFN